MDDLISRQAAIEALHMHLMYRMGTDSNKKRLDDWINSLPSAQPVRHGKWDYVTVVDEGFWRCSICGTPSEAIGAKKLYKYCPFCGAKMDAEQEAQNGR